MERKDTWFSDCYKAATVHGEESVDAQSADPQMLARRRLGNNSHGPRSEDWDVPQERAGDFFVKPAIEKLRELKEETAAKVKDMENEKIGPIKWLLVGKKQEETIKRLQRLIEESDSILTDVGSESDSAIWERLKDFCSFWAKFMTEKRRSPGGDEEWISDNFGAVFYITKEYSPPDEMGWSLRET